jgi:hypothetical protein
VTRTAHSIYARAEWRSRWRSYLFLAIVAGMVVGAVVVALTAAAQSESAFERLRTATRAADLAAGARDIPAAVAEVGRAARMRGVAGASAEAELFVRPEGTSYFPDFNLYSRAPIAASGSTPVNTPVIIAGRPVDPEAADEVVVSEALASKLHLDVGDTLRLESMTSAWVDAAYNGGGDPGPPDGPTIKVVVVGLSRTPADFARWKGLLHLSPAFVSRYGDQIAVYSRVEVRLSNGASRRMVASELRGLADDVEVSPPFFIDASATEDGLGTIATSLRLVAAIAALAGGVVLALATIRVIRLGLDERRTLMVLGWTTRQVAIAALFVVLPWLAVGVGVGVLGGVVLAPRALVGLAHNVDPTPAALVLDGRVVAGTAIAALALAVGAADLSARRFARRRPQPLPRPARMLPLGQPLPVVLGVRNALGGDVARGGRTSRWAVVVVAAGIAGAMAALMVSASISRLQTDPLLTGQGTGRVIDSGEGVDVYDRALPLLESDRRVATLAGIHISFGITAEGGRNLTTLAYDVKRGHIGASVLRGRIASRPDEVALGPVTLDLLHKNVGDSLRLRGKKGAGRFRIVGVMLFPEGDFEHDAGAALTSAGADRLLGNVHDNAELHQVLFEWSRRVDGRRADRTLAASGLDVLTGADTLKPASVTNLGQVEEMPRYLAAFLAVLSLVTLGHAITTGTRRRAREFGTLQALGVTPRARATIVATHTLTIVGIALLVGVPVGLLLGTRVWSSIADRANVVVRSVVPGSWVAVGALATFVAALGLAALPAWHAFRSRAVETLRAE